MRLFILALLMVGTHEVVEARQEGKGILDKAVVISGNVTFKEDHTAGTTTYTIVDSGKGAAVKVANKYAYSKDHQKSPSHQFTLRFQETRRATLSLGELEEIWGKDEELSEASFRRIVLCFPRNGGEYAVVSRDDESSVFAYTCLNADKNLWTTNDVGHVISEIPLVVSADTNSREEQYLRRPRQFIYMRLE
jgi:hypothetical protein